MTLKQELKKLKLDIKKKELEEIQRVKDEEEAFKARRKKRILKEYFDVFYNGIVEKMKAAVVDGLNEITLKFNEKDERYDVADELVDKFKKEGITTKIEYKTDIECDDSGSYDKYYDIDICIINLKW